MEFLITLGFWALIIATACVAGWVHHRWMTRNVPDFDREPNAHELRLVEEVYAQVDRFYQAHRRDAVWLYVISVIAIVAFIAATVWACILSFNQIGQPPVFNRGTGSDDWSFALSSSGNFFVLPLIWVGYFALCWLGYSLPSRRAQGAYGSVTSFWGASPSAVACGIADDLEYRVQLRQIQAIEDIDVYAFIGARLGRWRSAMAAATMLLAVLSLWLFFADARHQRAVTSFGVVTTGSFWFPSAPRTIAYEDVDFVQVEADANDLHYVVVSGGREVARFPIHIDDLMMATMMDGQFTGRGVSKQRLMGPLTNNERYRLYMSLSEMGGTGMLKF